MIGEKIGDPEGSGIHKIYEPKGGTLIEGVVITVIRPIPNRSNPNSSDNMLSGIIYGIQTFVKDNIFDGKN